MKLRSKLIACFCFVMSLTILAACCHESDIWDKTVVVNSERESANSIKSKPKGHSVTKNEIEEKNFDGSVENKELTKEKATEDVCEIREDTMADGDMENSRDAVITEYLQSFKNTVTTEEGQKGLDLYQKYLLSDGMYTLTATAEYPRGDSHTVYALGDCTGDETPELHIKGGSFYNIYTYQEGTVALLHSYDRGANPFEYGLMPLKDGGFVGYKPTGASYDNFYYRKMDSQGSFIDSVSRDFSIAYLVNGSNTYTIDGLQSTKEEFEEKIAPYMKLLDDRTMHLDWNFVFLEKEWDDLKRRNNDFFFPQDVSGPMYTSDFNFLTDLDDVEMVRLQVEELYRFDDGIVYELKIILPNDLPEENYFSYGQDRLHLGYFYVMEDSYNNQIYHIRDSKFNDVMQLKKEDWKKKGSLVCCNIETVDLLGEDEKGWHSWITRDENRIQYHSYNNTADTGYYENIIWEKGKGLVGYVSGYGAMKDHIGLVLIEE